MGRFNNLHRDRVDKWQRQDWNTGILARIYMFKPLKYVVSHKQHVPYDFQISLISKCAHPLFCRILRKIFTFAKETNQSINVFSFWQHISFISWRSSQLGINMPPGTFSTLRRHFFFIIKMGREISYYTEWIRGQFFWQISYND